MKQVYDRKENCFGCSACMSACPVNAIEMKEDRHGFLFPIIDQQKCIDCGKCKRSCQIFEHHNIVETWEEPEVYVCHNLEREDRIQSSSGGIAHVLAQYILQNQGVVFGAVYDENMNVKHVAISNIDDCNKIRKSKYVQSNMQDTYFQVEKILSLGKKVLFIGTPCQIGGLYQFLGKDYDSLYTVDLICFGVPSPLVFKEYISWFEKRESQKVTFVDWRDKKKGWSFSSTKIVCKSGKEYTMDSNQNEYYQTFSSHIAIRESCGNCIYTNVKRYADLTVGDYWGIEKFKPNYDTFEGVSKVLINTEKGKALFMKISDRLYMERMPIETAIRPNLLAPLKLHVKRNEFFNYFEKKGFYKAYRKYVLSKKENKYIRKIKRILKKVIR